MVGSEIRNQNQRITASLLLIVERDVIGSDLGHLSPPVPLSPARSALLLRLRHEAADLRRDLRAFARGALGLGLLPFGDGHGELEGLLHLSQRYSYLGMGLSPVSASEPRQILVSTL